MTGLYASALAFLYFNQRALVFPAPPPAAIELREGERLLKPGGTGLAFFIPPSDGMPVVVFFHGNGDQVAYEVPFGRALHERTGAGFYAVEYPGFGGVPGEATEESLYDAAGAAVQALRTDLGVSAERTVLYGQSLGSGVAVELAARGLGARLLLVTPYTALPDVAASIYPWVPVSLLMKDRFESAQKAPRIGVPVLIIHGTDDEVVPFHLGEALSKRFPHAVLHAVSGAHHNDVVHRPESIDAMDAFFRAAATGR